MADQIPYIRVFISSPGDVNDERKIALEVIEQLPYQPVFRDKVAFRIVAWDKPGAGTSMRVTMTPQDAINRGLPKPSECDIVVVIFWSRMGTPFKDQDGIEYESGTHWELLDAIQGERSQKQTIIYHRTEEKQFTAKQKADIEQYERLETFFESELFYEDGRIKGGVNHYEKPEDFRQQFEIHFQELMLEVLKAIDKHPLDTPTPTKTPDNENIKTIEAEEWNPERSPFPGLRAFTEVDADIFFGRGAETDALVQQLTVSRFVAVIASSGSGKSSLVGAGLIPRLRANTIEGSKDWRIARFTPSDNPFDGLYSAMLEAFPEFKPNPLEAKRIKDNFITDMRGSPQALIDICAVGMENDPEWAQVLLFIDQFEELFTLTSRDDAEAFIRALETIAKGDRLRVVVTMRADFYHRALEYPELADLLRRGSFPLAIPKRDALRQMIERPAERANIEFEGELINRILDDVGDEPGNLALMAYALDEMYKLDDDGILTFVEYEELGGVQGAIGTRAENVWQALDLDETVLHQVFLRLVEVDERGTATRRRSEFQPDNEPEDIIKLIHSFADARLLITGNDTITNTATMEIAHEAILREWNRLSDWIAERQADFRVIARMRRDAQWWTQTGKREQDLPRAEQIDEFRQACKNLGIVLNEKHDALLIEFSEDERDRLIQSLATGHVDKNKYDYVMYRLQQIDGDEFMAHCALVSNQDADKHITDKLIPILIKSNDRRAVEPLIGQLKNNNTNVNSVIRTLGKLGDRRAVEPLIAKLDDENIYVRTVIIEALERLGDERAVEPLIAKLNDNEFKVCQAVINALVKLDDGRAVEPLIAKLNDNEFKVRQAVINALVELGDGRAVEPLIAQYDNSPSYTGLELLHALGKLGDKRAVEPLITKLDDDDKYVQWAVARALGKLGDKRAVEPLIAKLDDNDIKMQHTVLEALAKLGDGRAVEPLIAKLNDNDKYEQRLVVHALGKLGDKRAVEPLIAKLGDEDWEVRNAVGEALVKLGDERAFEPLIAKLDADNRGERRTVARVLGQLGDERAVEPLIALLLDDDDSDWKVQQAVVSGLGKLGDERAVEPLISKLGNDNRQLEEAIIIALLQLRGKLTIDLLIAKFDDDNKNVQQAVVRALGKLGDERVFDYLIAKLDDNDKRMQHAISSLHELKDDKKMQHMAVRALGELGDGRALATLIAKLDDADKGIQRASAYALGKLRDKRAVLPLLVKLGNDDRYVRRAVVKALEELKDTRAIESLEIALKNETDHWVRKTINVTLEKLQAQNIDTES